MYIRAVKLAGFRGLEGTVTLGAGLAVVAGPNNAGKSSIVDAIRLVTVPYYDQRSRPFVQASDFSHDGQGEPMVSSLSITLVLAGLSATERGRMVTCLAPEQGADVAVLTLQATLGDDGKVMTTFTGGDHSNPDVESFARTAVKFVYLPPLRDAARDLRPGHSNRLGDLVSSFAPSGHADRAVLEDILNDANGRLTGVEAVKQANDAIAASLNSITGRAAFAHKAEMRFTTARFERIVANLRALVGKLAPLELDENGLGFNNLLYMAVLLSVLKKSEEASLRLLLVEEPEAHLHPQLQDLLMKYLDGQATAGTQVIVTTHSPQFASSASVERLTVLAERPRSADIGTHLGSLDLDQKQRKFLRRFLDVTKSSLLFSRGVILVEGVAEQLLVPAFAKRLGLDLSEHGIAVVNVGGLSFASYAALFGHGGLPVRCAIITDGDRISADPVEAGAEEQVGDTQADATDDGTRWEYSKASAAIKSLEGGSVKVFLSEQTFEWDLAFEGQSANKAALLEALKPIRPVVAGRIESHTPGEIFANAFLKAVADFKGPFAQELAEVVAERVSLGDSEQNDAVVDSLEEPATLVLNQHDASDRETTLRMQLPEYISEAIYWAAGLRSPADLRSEPRPS